MNIIDEIRQKRKELKELETLDKKKFVDRTFYMHESGDSMISEFNELKLPEDTWSEFKGLLYEIPVRVRINRETGKGNVLWFKYCGKKYVPEVKK